MDHAHGVREGASHGASPQARHEDEQSGDRQQDAADGNHAVRHAGEQRMTLDVASHSHHLSSG